MLWGERDICRMKRMLGYGWSYVMEMEMDMLSMNSMNILLWDRLKDRGLIYTVDSYFMENYLSLWWNHYLNPRISQNISNQSFTWWIIFHLQIMPSDIEVLPYLTYPQPPIALEVSYWIPYYNSLSSLDIFHSSYPYFLFDWSAYPIIFLHVTKR